MRKFLGFTVLVMVLTVTVAGTLGIIWLERGLNHLPGEVEPVQAQTYKEATLTEEKQKKREVTLSYTISDAADDYYIKKRLPMREIISSELGVSEKKLSEVNNSDFTVGEEVKIPLGSKRSFSNKCASFYGGKFEGRKTASGEIFRTLKVNTVASKFLPLGTRIEITNLENGVKREAVVNDHGPYYPSCEFQGERVPRTLDLTWGLAATLRMKDRELNRARKKDLIIKHHFLEASAKRAKDYQKEPQNEAERALRKANSEGITRVSYRILDFPDNTNFTN